MLSSTMEACNSVSVLLYRSSKPVGKVRRRVRGLRHPSSSCCDNAAKLDLSHNESARFAVDSLLCQGLEGYHRVLEAEGEVDFLSELEKDYILQNRSDAHTDDAGEKDEMDREFHNSFADGRSRSRCFKELSNSDSTGEKIYKVTSAAPQPDDGSAEVFFHTDIDAAGMKDLVRRFIRKAKLALAVVMDSFSDPELLCDLLEASRKRNVSVHLLLDHLNLKGFVSMWQDLKLISKNFPKVSVRSVPGQTYCAKTGQKLSGQITESFIIADWDEVLTGTYSFTWLSGQVHRGLLVLIKGSSASHFHQEILRLYSSSKPVPGFVTFVTLPQSLCLYSRSSKPQTPVSYNQKSQQPAAAGPQPPRSPPGLLRHLEETRAPRETPDSGSRAGAEGRMQSVTVGRPQHALGAACTQLNQRVKVELLGRNQEQLSAQPDLPAQTVSDVQSWLHSTVNTTAETNVELQEPHTVSAMCPADKKQRDVYYQPGVKTENSLAHPEVTTDGVFSQQRSRNVLTEPQGFNAGTKTQRNQRDSSRNRPPCDQPELPSPSISQQMQSKTSHHIPFSSPREYITKLQPSTTFRETSKQQTLMKQYQGPVNSPSYTASSCFKPAPAGMGTAKMHLQPVTSLQLNPAQRMHWVPQKAAGPRGIIRYNSFSGAHVMEQAGWRPLQHSRNTLMRRSLSMTERCAAGYRGAGFHPN